MTRAQRNAHRLVWWVLGPLLLASVFYSLFNKPTLPREELPASVAPGEAPGRAKVAP